MFRLIYREVMTVVILTFALSSPSVRLEIVDLDGVACRWSRGRRSSVGGVFAVAIEHKGANVLRDDLSGLAFELDQFLEVGEGHVAFDRELCGSWLDLGLHVNDVLEEVAQQEDVRPVVLRVELLEQGDHANHEVRWLDFS